MRLPRQWSGADLKKALTVLGYEETRQTGSHVRMTTRVRGEHHVTVPDHKVLLNKFAPSGNVRTPLKSRLVDVTARGRSMGLVLVGAEQFASSVERSRRKSSKTVPHTSSAELKQMN